MNHPLRTLFAAAFVGLPIAASAANLIVNPGNDLPMVGGEISGWTEVVGTNWRQRTHDPAPFDGNSFFFAGVGSSATLRQTVDVSSLATAIDAGTQQFDFNGYVRSYPQSPSDTSEIVLSYLDAGAAVLGSFASGAIASPTAWQLVSNTWLAPAQTRAIQVDLIATRHNGSNNDGYFDGLSLSASAVAPPVPEPKTYLLMLAGLAALCGYRARANGRRASR